MSAGLDRVSQALRFVDVYGDALRIYRLLFRRSVLTAADKELTRRNPPGARR